MSGRIIFLIAAALAAAFGWTQLFSAIPGAQLAAPGQFPADGQKR